MYSIASMKQETDIRRVDNETKLNLIELNLIFVSLDRLVYWNTNRVIGNRHYLCVQEQGYGFSNFASIYNNFNQ